MSSTFFTSTLLIFINTDNYTFMYRVLIQYAMLFSYDKINLENDFFTKFHLTKRERSVYLYILEGMSDDEVANTLFISKSTVRKHLQSIFIKTGAKNRYQLIVNYFQRG